MTRPHWPETLPPKPLAARYQETLADTALRTQMEQGPAKLRRRTTAGVGLLELSYLLSAAATASLEAFYRETLAGGTLAFDLAHPRHGGTVTARFKKPPVLTPHNSHYTARLELEILP